MKTAFLILALVAAFMPCTALADESALNKIWEMESHTTEPWKLARLLRMERRMLIQHVEALEEQVAILHEISTIQEGQIRSLTVQVSDLQNRK